MVSFRRTVVLSLVALCGAPVVLAWTLSSSNNVRKQCSPRCNQGLFSLQSSSDAWNGEVVSNSAGGKINGCSIEPVGEEPVLEWVIKVDGEEADLGRFSDAIYRKITADAKKEKFQGFRPGTIPPHLQPTYKAFAMDECARETVLEAMQQNNIKPFDNSRSDLVLENFLIPPSTGKKKKMKKKRKKAPHGVSHPVAEEVVKEPKWRTFESMKKAIDAGWKPGQSFSFVAKNVRGQKVRSEQEVRGSSPLGIDF